MELKEAVKIVEKHQAQLEDKSEFGVAIDVMINHVNKKIKLKDRLSKPMILYLEMEVELIDDLIDWNDNEEIDWLITKMLPESSVEVYNKIAGDYITKSKKIKYFLT